MLIIKKLSKMIKEEICDAEKYANCALKYKDEDKALADAFYNLASDELKHMNILHEQVVRIIGEYRNKNGSPPEAMQALLGGDYKPIEREQPEPKPFALPE